MTEYTIKKEAVGFTQVDNRILNNPELTAKSKGLYAFLYGKPDGWQFSADRICKEFKDGRRSILTGLAELEANELLKRKRCGDGRVIYNLLLHPKCQNRTLDKEKPKCQNRTVPKPHSAKTAPISNKEGEVINIDEVIKNKQLSIDTPSGNVVNETIALFKEVNPSYQTLFPRKGERDATERLLKVHGKDRLWLMIKKLPKTNSLKGAVTATTPYQLEKNIGRIKARVDQERNITRRQKKAVTLLGVK